MSKTMNTRLRAMLLEDALLIRRALALMLDKELGIEVAGSFGTSGELFEAMSEQPADVIIANYSLGADQMDGLTLIRCLKQRFPLARLLVLSSLYTAAMVGMVIRAGAHGFVGTIQSPSELLGAVRAVAAGQTSFNRRLLAMVDPDASPVEAMRSFKLSPREHEVVRCVLDGMSVTDIARKFSRSVTTISQQKKMAFCKLGVRNNHELFKTWRSRDHP
jgi:DNA-binding NarL/FixJ family response regulator